METQRILMRSLAVVFIASVIWTITDAEEKVHQSRCYIKFSTVNFTDPIISVRMQKESLPCVKAVIFETERGEFCYDWKQPWVQKKVKQFSRAQRIKPTSKPSPGNIQETPENSSLSCCTAVSKAEFTDPISGFRTQKESLPCVKAIIFETERGEICYDWRQPWVQEKMMQFLRTHSNKA